MAKFHISARTHWQPFEYQGTPLSLNHLDAHEVVFTGIKGSYTFVVTYGLHCFAKDNQPYSIPLTYCDGRETRQINLERYFASRKLRQIIENFDKGKLLYETVTEKFFNIELINDLNGKIQLYKVCMHFFKENRLLRIHVTSAFFDTSDKKIKNKAYSIFKVAMDTKKRARNRGVPKEALNK